MTVLAYTQCDGCNESIHWNERCGQPTEQRRYAQTQGWISYKDPSWPNRMVDFCKECQENGRMKMVMDEKMQVLKKRQYKYRSIGPLKVNYWNV